MQLQRLTGANILCDPLFQDVARSRLKVGQGGLRRGVLAFKYIHCNVLVKIYETNGTFKSQYIFNFRGCVELWVHKDTELWHVHLVLQVKIAHEWSILICLHFRIFYYLLSIFFVTLVIILAWEMLTGQSQGCKNGSACRWEGHQGHRGQQSHNAVLAAQLPENHVKEMQSYFKVT